MLRNLRWLVSTPLPAAPAATLAPAAAPAPDRALAALHAKLPVPGKLLFDTSDPARFILGGNDGVMAAYKIVALPDAPGQAPRKRAIRGKNALAVTSLTRRGSTVELMLH